MILVAASFYIDPIGEARLFSFNPFMKLQLAGTLNGYTIENLKDERPITPWRDPTSNIQ
jgi:hypothetical protein